MYIDFFEKTIKEEFIFYINLFELCLLHQFYFLSYLFIGYNIFTRPYMEYGESISFSLYVCLSVSVSSDSCTMIDLRLLMNLWNRNLVGRLIIRTSIPQEIYNDRAHVAQFMSHFHV